jgi:LmbE family N-acetylglucosaminyl deacetylase
MDFTKLLNPIADLFSPSNLLLKKPIPFTVMLLSPHPDDESISGALALRLLKENNAHVVNVAVTLGSNKARQKERRRELETACKVLDVECVYLGEDWRTKERELKGLIQKYAPSLIMAPHSKDFHPAHVRTSELCRKVLATFKKESIIVAWSEFWAPQAKPNLLLEVPSEILELQMKALEMHVGEVTRNPYHLRLPGWMIDNVRRGTEVISGKGSEAPAFPFGVLYRVQLLKNGKFTSPRSMPSILTVNSDLAQIFKLILDAASGSRTKVK